METRTTPRGIRNNNPLNIRKGNNWKGERPVQHDRSFEEFTSMEAGIRAAFIIIRNYMTGYDGRVKPLTCIDDIIRRWAPPSENRTEDYIRFVSAKTEIHRYERILFRDRKKMVAILQAMAWYECGQTIPAEKFQSAYDLV